MHIDIEVPETIAQRLTEQWGDLPDKLLEILAVEAYRNEILTSAEVGRLLGLHSRWEVDAFLKQAKAYLHYTEDDLAQDRQTLQRLREQ
ncbi:MAG: hypothetical protein DCF17_03045 [Shackletoniella antarctica]|jgi:predicted HTH domain antitoxin|uniref:Uncharacterized protein n=1 Tax=Shackletoniella antarctica TaxID=268115 RepID=A0A2W4YC12_9CYAN|nr:MAG: hypothetical protein DCF17_03045 [Shackletoniella antarctica]